MVEPLVELSSSWTFDNISGLFAYIGPGAGLAIAGSFLAILIAVLMIKEKQ